MILVKKKPRRRAGAQKLSERPLSREQRVRMSAAFGEPQPPRECPDWGTDPVGYAMWQIFYGRQVQ